MKKLLICTMAVIMYCYSYAQKPSFIRVYGYRHHLIAKGYLCYSTDSTADICRHPGKKSLTVSVKDIWVVKTKHTAGHNLLAGVTVGFTAGALLGLTAHQDKDSWIVFDRGTITAFGAIGGTGYGSILGIIAAVFRHSKTFVIKGDLIKWQEARRAVVITGRPG